MVYAYVIVADSAKVEVGGQTLSANEVDLKRARPTTGIPIVVDPETEEILSAEMSFVRRATEDAKKLWRGTFRPGFELKDI